MSEEIHIQAGLTREEKYRLLLPQIEALMKGEADPVAKQANFCAALKDTFGFLWIGFYRVMGDELVLGPFQGPVACTRIARGKGVCGTAWEQNKTLIVPDVNQFPGHIACSSFSKSEIVVPVAGEDGKVNLILDIDSGKIDDFGTTDRKYLEQMVTFVL